jgi:hypothetical protein
MRSLAILKAFQQNMPSGSWRDFQDGQFQASVTTTSTTLSSYLSLCHGLHATVMVVTSHWLSVLLPLLNIVPSQKLTQWAHVTDKWAIWRGNHMQPHATVLLATARSASLPGRTSLQFQLLPCLHEIQLLPCFSLSCTCPLCLEIASWRLTPGASLQIRSILWIRSMEWSNFDEMITMTTLTRWPLSRGPRSLLAREDAH